MTQNKRKLPKKGEMIKPVNINGGFTEEREHKIYITRKEEFAKVILHEILHHNNYIHYHHWKPSNINKLKRHFNIDQSMSLIPNEAIVEFWATITHLKMVAKDYKLDYDKLLDEEIKYSLFKSYQLLKMQGKESWNEKTNAFCYIIFKTIFLVNLNKFQKIYKFPYDEDAITEFLIKNSKLPLISKNPTNKRANNSLCMMVNSDF